MGSIVKFLKKNVLPITFNKRSITVQRVTDISE